MKLLPGWLVGRISRMSRTGLSELVGAVGVFVTVVLLAIAMVRSPASAVAPIPTATPTSPVQPFHAAYRWPLDGTPAVVVAFNPPDKPWLPGQRGVDLASTPGATVFAAGRGVVAFAGVVAGTGVVSVDHAGGLRTTYEPVRATVHAGEPINEGAPLGILEAGQPRCPIGIAACLHWGLRRGTTYLNPLLLIGLSPVRLKPV